MTTTPDSPSSYVEAVRQFAASLMPGKDAWVAPDLAAAIPALSKLCGPISNVPVAKVGLKPRAFVAELCYAAVNYSYWGRSSSDRPGGDSHEVRLLIFSHFAAPIYPDVADAGIVANEFTVSSGEVIALASKIEATPLPLAPERASAVLEIANNLEVVALLWRRASQDQLELDRDLAALVQAFPSFGADPFLKRALLFYALMYRIYGLASIATAKLVLPADYQVPRVMRAAGVIEYSARLDRMIQADVQLPAGSREELEIRAAAVMAGDQLARALRIPVERVDDWLWRAGRRLPGKHHLTRTTFY